MTTNIGRDNADANFRYKMPVLTTKVEGRGNGIKTVIPNMADIAKALHIHPAYPTKFFGIELGAQSNYNVDTERAVVNGQHQAGDLSKILDRFIQQFILCPHCKLPELKMSIKSSGIKIECAACGDSSVIKSGHRLVGFMQKNPPKSFSSEASGSGDKEKKKKKKKSGSDDELDEDAQAIIANAKAGGSSSVPAADEPEKEKKEKKEKKDETPEERAARKAKKAEKKEKKEKKKKERKEETPEERAARKARKAEKKAKKAEKKAAGGGSDSDSSDDDEADEKPAAAATSASAVPAASEPAAEKKKESASPKDDAEDDDEEESEEEDADGDESEWHTDTSKDAVKKRAEAEFSEMLAGARKDVENIVLSAKADNKSDSPVTILKIFLASAKTPRTSSEIAAELRRLGMSRGLDESQKLKTLLEAIIDITSPKTVVEQFKAKADLLKYFARQPSALSSSSGGAASPNESNKNSGTMLLTCIEDLIGVVERKLLPAAPKILEALYDAEVLDEPTLVAWYDAPPEASWLVNKDVAAEVRAKARPFIDWLRTADEEDDE